jgi:hypothetical protein
VAIAFHQRIWQNDRGRRAPLGLGFSASAEGFEARRDFCAPFVVEFEASLVSGEEFSQGGRAEGLVEGERIFEERESVVDGGIPFAEEFASLFDGEW